MMLIRHLKELLILNQSQQEYLRAAMHELSSMLGIDLTREDFAKRLGAPWDTYRRWLLPPESSGSREMPPVAWSLVREVLEHERLKVQHLKLKQKVIKKA
jgi:DNA-directed RNA polymerase specialized sigma subunit